MRAARSPPRWPPTNRRAPVDDPVVVAAMSQFQRFGDEPLIVAIEERVTYGTSPASDPSTPEETTMAALLQDVRFGLRTLGQAPGVTVAAVIALALGIGANTAMFSIVNAVLFKPLPYADAGRLAQLYTSMPQFREASVSYPNFLDWQQRSRSFDSMAAYRGETFNLTGDATPERLRGEMASADIFAALGVRPILGRTFGSDEDRKGGAPVVVLTS